jgi:hypothetical protein
MRPSVCLVCWESRPVLRFYAWRGEAGLVGRALRGGTREELLELVGDHLRLGVEVDAPLLLRGGRGPAVLEDAARQRRVFALQEILVLLRGALDGAVGVVGVLDRVEVDLVEVRRDVRVLEARLGGGFGDPGPCAA